MKSLIHSPLVQAALALLFAVPVLAQDQPTTLFPERRKVDTTARDAEDAAELAAKLSAYMRQLDTDDRSKRINAAVQLMELGPKARPALPVMKRCAAAEQVPEIRALIVKAIQVVEGRAASPIQTRQDTAAQRERLQKFIGQLRAPEALERRKAVIGIRTMGAAGAPAIPDLRRAAEQDEDPFVKKLAGRAIRYIREQQRDAVGERAEPAGAVKKAEADVETLTSQLFDKSPAKRARACLLLGDLGHAAKKALPALQRVALSDPDRDVANAAARASRKIISSQPPPARDTSTDAAAPGSAARGPSSGSATARFAETPLHQLVARMAAKDEAEVIAVIRAIGSRGADAVSAIPALRSQTMHKDPDIALAARQAMDVIFADRERRDRQASRDQAVESNSRGENQPMRRGDTSR